MKICIIENSQQKHEELHCLLKDGFPDAEIIPSIGKACRNWQTALRLVRDKTRQDDDIVFCLDIALDGEETENISEGINSAGRIRQLRPSATLVAITNYALAVRREPKAESIYDEILDRLDPEWNRMTSQDRAEHLRQIITRARRKHGSEPDQQFANIDFEFRDSLGFRLLEAALGNDGIQELLELETRDWEKRTIRALSGGFSGSHLIEVSGSKAGLAASLVMKIALSANVIDDEINAPSKFNLHLGIFAGRVNAGLKRKPLSSRRAFYYVQPKVTGDTLLDLLKRDSEEHGFRALRSLLDLLVEQYKSQMTKVRPQKRDLTSCFGMRAADPYRMENSVDFLSQLSAVLERQKSWSSGMPKPHELFSALREMFGRWDDLVVSEEGQFWVLQHGDLNPGNVLVNKNQIAFIDLARLNIWPVGYDFSRLATQLRVRLVEREDNQDWINNRITEWLRELFANLAEDVDTSLCKAAGLCDSKYLSFVKSRPKRERESLRGGVES